MSPVAVAGGLRAEDQKRGESVCQFTLQFFKVSISFLHCLRNRKGKEKVYKGKKICIIIIFLIFFPMFS